MWKLRIERLHADRLHYAGRVHTGPRVLLDLFIYSDTKLNFTNALDKHALKCSAVMFCYRTLQGGCRKDLEQVTLVGGCERSFVFQR